MEITDQQIAEACKRLHFENRALIAGQWVAAYSGETFPCISPIDGKKLCEVASCEVADVNKAVNEARRSFDSGIWRQQPPADRKKKLLKLAELVEQHRLELALLETMDMGKPIAHSYGSDIPEAAEKIRWVAECIDKFYGEIAPTPDSKLGMICRESLGVVAAVTAWNYPFYLACGKLAPALATGNSVILKPAEQAPLSTLRLAALAMEAGIPEGVIQVLPGYGRTVGKALGLHAGVDMVSFTGSTEVGKLFLSYSSASNMKRLLLECGGKSPVLVFSDCADIQKAASSIAAAVFDNQGETCCAPTRLLIERPIIECFLEKFFEVCQQYFPDSPLSPKTLMGAMVDQAQTERVLSYIAAGEAQGASKLLGGRQVRQETGGYYIEPTVFGDVSNTMKIAQEEIFGPVIALLPFDEVGEALQIANDSCYGLAASVWTENRQTIYQAIRGIRAGVVSVNTTGTGDHTTTFGGYKQSGIGRQGGFHQFQHYTELKTIWMELA